VSRTRRDDYDEFLAAVAETFGGQTAHVAAALRRQAPRARAVSRGQAKRVEPKTRRSSGATSR
jgi:hypothetical protein